MLLCHSDPLIHHVNLNLLVRLVAFFRYFNSLDVDLSSGLGKLDGVGQQIDDNLHHAESVYEIQLLGSFLSQEVDFDFFQLGFGAHNLDHLIEHGF
jgi:hypothetical protein